MFLVTNENMGLCLYIPTSAPTLVSAFSFGNSAYDNYGIGLSTDYMSFRHSGFGARNQPDLKFLIFGQNILKFQFQFQNVLQTKMCYVLHLDSSTPVWSWDPEEKKSQHQGGSKSTVSLKMSNEFYGHFKINYQIFKNSTEIA